MEGSPENTTNITKISGSVNMATMQVMYVCIRGRRQAVLLHIRVLSKYSSMHLYLAFIKLCSYHMVATAKKILKSENRLLLKILGVEINSQRAYI